MEDAMEKKTFKWMRILQGVVCLFLVLYGMSLCLESILSVPIPWQARLIAAAVLTAALQFVQPGWKWALAESLLFAGGFAVFCVKYQEILLIGMKELANRILELINAYNRTEYLLWYLDIQKSYRWHVLLLVFVLLGFLEGLLLMCTRNMRCHFLIAAIFPTLIVSAGLMVGKPASFAGILLAFLGLLLEVLDIRERGTFLMGGVVAVGIGISILLVGNAKLWGQIELWHVDWYQRQLNLEDRMLAWIEEISQLSIFSSGEQMQYTLENDRPSFSGEEIFKITVDYPISSPLYIRGFVGGTYEDGKWKRISRQEFSDWAHQQGSDEETYAGIVQSYPYEFLSYSPMFYGSFGTEKHVLLELSQELDGYTLMPYFTKVTDEQTFRADGIYPPGKETQFEWDSYMGLVDYDRDLASSIYAETFFETISAESEIMKANQVFTAYQEYAQQKYTRMPEDGLDKLKSYVEQYKKTHPGYWETMEAASDKLKEAGGQNGWDLTELEQLLTEDELNTFTMSEMEYNINAILTMLWEDNEYSLDLEKAPKGEDGVEYFLFEQHKGYCAHFATAATLLFRMNDIPARYVSGYLVVPSDFKKNNDGTWTAVVTDERAHAWTEIFFENIGFSPIETTPPEYVELLDGMKEGENLAQAVRQMEEEKRKHKDKEQENEGEQEDKKEPEDEKEQEDIKKQEDAKKTGGIKAKDKADTPGITGDDVDFLIRGILVGLAEAVILLIFRWRRRWVLQDRQRRFEGADRTRAVREIGKEMAKILRLMGMKRQSGINGREYGTVLGQQMPEMDWDRIFYILQKAEFSEHGVTEEEYLEIFLLYQKLEKKLLSTGGARGWYLKCMRIYS